ncbi:MAG: hypothetical protein B6244_14315 [Candidatus Cloacimonetes bacterium 4572_55]|nr:MAG: hypothetical protein B6244_14315 [Candidatus Cloacimonetes bacterium 4572_55]
MTEKATRPIYSTYRFNAADGTTMFSGAQHSETQTIIKEEKGRSFVTVVAKYYYRKGMTAEEKAAQEALVRNVYDGDKVSLENGGTFAFAIIDEYDEDIVPQQGSTKQHKGHK